MLISVLFMYESTKNETYFDFLKQFIDYYIDDEGNILGYDLDAMNSDSINEGKVLFTLYKKTKDEKYRKAMEYVSIFSMQSSETLLVVPI